MLDEEVNGLADDHRAADGGNPAGAAHVGDEFLRRDLSGGGELDQVIDEFVVIDRDFFGAGDFLENEIRAEV